MTILANEPPSIQALGTLLATSPDWRLSPGSTPAMSIYLRAYPDGWVDVLTLLGEDDARGHRANPDGLAVWRHEGGLAEVANALRALPLPDTPDAPTLILPGREQSLWTLSG